MRRTMQAKEQPLSIKRLEYEVFGSKGRNDESELSTIVEIYCISVLRKNKQPYVIKVFDKVIA